MANNAIANNNSIMGVLSGVERNPRAWAFLIVGIITGGVIGSVGLFGVMLQSVTTDFVALTFITLIGWAIGAAIGGVVGSLLNRLTGGA